VSRTNQPDLPLPADVDCERTVLGAILLDNQALPEVMEAIKPADLSLDSHRRIALRMAQLYSAGIAVDIRTLADKLKSTHEIESVGGVAYLASLTEGLPRRPVIEDYLRIIKDKSMLRRLMGVCSAAIARSADQGETALELLGATQSQLEQISEGYRSPTSGPIARFIADALARDEEEYRNKGGRHIPSGNRWFDWKTGGGYRCGRITLVCARPGVGKSSWALMSVAHNCSRGNRSVVFSFEMEKEEILRGLIPYLVDVPGIVVDQPELRTP
jgi:replicative DNA helicase